MKFKLDIEKKKSTDVGQAEGHNSRLHGTQSQLPEPAWLDKNGHYAIVESDYSKLQFAKSLAKRKDAVLAVQLVFQVGAQEDWRDLPTPEYPYGKPKKGMRSKINAIAKGAQEAAEKEFGKENVVSIDLHLDESSPHVHVIVIPVFEGKLQAKHWLNGVEACAALRRRVHETLLKHIECTYTPGNSNRDPHDPSKGAGGINGPQPVLSWSQKAAAAVSVPKIISELKKKCEGYEKQIKALFLKVKRLQLLLSKEIKAHTKEKLNAVAVSLAKDKETALKLEELKRSNSFQISKLQRENAGLTSDNNELAEQNNELKSAARKQELRR